MSLEKGKSYGHEERQKALLDVSRSKLEASIPHQAPQRDRVSMAALPLSKQEKRAARRKNLRKRWPDMLHPDKRMGVPQLMMLLEPNVVWEHTRAYVEQLGFEVESQYGIGDFFEGWHKMGRCARGVYEGSYWELMGDCDDMAEMLRAMSQAPPLMEEEELVLPEQAELPKWDDFKPILQVLPSTPTMPVLKIPPFRPPILDTELPFFAPGLVPVPDVPDQPSKEPLPTFEAPEQVMVENFVEEEFVHLEPPTIPAPPVPPKFGKPEYGYSWQRATKGEPEKECGVHGLHNEWCTVDGVPECQKCNEKECGVHRVHSAWSTGADGQPQCMKCNERECEVHGVHGAWRTGADGQPQCKKCDTGRILAEDEDAEDGSWVGAHPFKKDEPVYKAPAMLELATWKHPPRPLPKLPLSENLELDEADIELEPVPKLELAWDCGPDPEPAYASISATPMSMSRATTPAHSRPTSAGPLFYASPSGSRPASGVQRNSSPQRPSTPPLNHDNSRAASAGGPRAGSAGSGNSGGSAGDMGAGGNNAADGGAGKGGAKNGGAGNTGRPTSGHRGGSRPPSARSPSLARQGSRPQSGQQTGPGQHPASPLFPTGESSRSRPSSGLRPTGQMESPRRGPGSMSSGQGDLEWESTSSTIDTGRPHMWLNFNKPFADLPPVFMPDKPEMGVFNGPEPMPEDFTPEGLEELPEFQVPDQVPLPKWEAPEAPKTPQWVPPCEPRPVGFMRGTAPVLILDMSGTMNPAQRGKINELKNCVCEILHPQGELGTSAGLFDVIAFSNQAWAWSATYAQRLSLLSSTQIQYSGRQNGGKFIPRGTSGKLNDRRNVHGAQLMPTEAELLEDARHWVDHWPGGVGHTNMLTSYLMADNYWNADAWYIFSDGLANDQGLCLDFLEQRAAHGHRCPIIHAVGFFPDDAPEGFEGRRFLKKLAEITKGSYQEYNPRMLRIYQEGVGFVDYDVRKEKPEVTEERLWAEAQLRAERKKNIRLGIVEKLDVTMARVRALHEKTRVQPMLVEHNELLRVGQLNYEKQMASIIAENTARKQSGMDEYMARLNAVSQSNQEKIDAANTRYQTAHARWVQAFEIAEEEWEASKTALEAEREEAIKKYQGLQVARSRTPSPPLSRPGSAQAPVSRVHKPRTQPVASPHAFPQSPKKTAPEPPAPASPPVESPRPAPQEPKPVDMSVLYKEEESAEPYVTDSGQVVAAFAQASAAVWGQDSQATSLLPPGTSNAVTLTDAMENAMAGREQEPRRPTSGSSGRPLSGQSQRGMIRPPSAGPSRPSSARPTSASGCPASASGRPTSASAGGAGATGAGNQSSLQQLIEEGDGDEIIDVEGQPSCLSLSGEDKQQQQQQQQQRNRPASNSSNSSVMRHQKGQQGLEDDGFVVEDEGEGLDYYGDLPALLLEDSMELKRRIHPPEVVQELDEGNTERLAIVRAEWEALLSDTAERNARKIAALAHNQVAVNKYIKDVMKTYSSSYVRDVVMNRCVKRVTNERLTKAAEDAHDAAVNAIRAENARIADLHTKEIALKRQKEAQYKEAVERWQKNKAEAWADHEAEVAEARATHDANVKRMRAEWEAREAEVKSINNSRIRQAEEMHMHMIDEINAINGRFAQEHLHQVEKRKTIENQNKALMSEAKVAHKVKLQQLAIKNEERLAEVQKEHEALCVRLTQNHHTACEVAQREFEELRVFLTAHNESVLEAARQKYAAAVAAAQAEFEELCAQIREEHEESTAIAREHNKTVWPQVLIARLALEELGRVMAFAEHIKFCANKLQMGVNFMPNTPCYERVVEMQALNEALIKAFPEFHPAAYPWPDSDLRLQPGTGWVASPEAKSNDIKDPAIMIIELAAGKRSAAAAIAAAMPREAKWRSQPMSAKTAGSPISSRGPSSALGQPQSASIVQPWMLEGWSPEAQHWIQHGRPMSAARPQSAGSVQGSPEGLHQIAEEGRSRPASAPYTPVVRQRQLSAGRFSSLAGSRPLSSTSQLLSSEPTQTQITSPGSPRSSPYQTLTAGPLTGMAATAPGSPIHHGLQRRSVCHSSGHLQPEDPHVRALSAGPTLSPTGLRSSAPTMFTMGGNRPRSGLSTKSPPRAGRGSRAARMSVDLGGLQATVNMHRLRKGASAFTKQQNYVFSPIQSGFRNDFPKAEFPLVDVRALGDLQ